MNAVVGYARASTREQSIDSQVAKLLEAGAERVFADAGESSRKASRPKWAKCQDYLRPGDVLLVTSLDRLAGTTTLVITAITELGDRGIELPSLSEPVIDTTTWA